MFKADPLVTCPSCGQPNAAREKFCTACAARLGEEPSIGAARPRVAAPSARDSAFGAPRTVHSGPVPLRAPPPDAAGFWFKFCMAGLVLMLGFLGWALYVMSGSRAVPPAPLARSVAPAAAGPDVAPPIASAVAPAVPAAAPAAPAATSPQLMAEPRAAAARPVARERNRRPARERAPAVEADGDAWVMPSRAPAVTSSPQFRDAGPPIVEGPRPGAFGQSARPGVVMPAPDLGPPIAVGPGPRYDYSTPNAGTPP